MLPQENILTQTLVRLGLLSPADLTLALEYQMRLPQGQWQPIPKVLSELALVSERVLQFLQALPVATLEQILELRRQKQPIRSNKIVAFRTSMSDAQGQGKATSRSMADQAFLKQLQAGDQLQEWEIQGVIEIQAKQPAMLRQSLAELFVSEGYLSLEQIHQMWSFSNLQVA